MSRKTRKEKKIADYRKKQKFLQQLTKNNKIEEPKQISEAPSEKTRETTENQSRQTYFFKDLKKSLTIISLIITLEIIIYFVRMNG